MLKINGAKEKIFISSLILSKFILIIQRLFKAITSPSKSILTLGCHS